MLAFGTFEMNFLICSIYAAQSIHFSSKLMNYEALPDRMFSLLPRIMLASLEITSVPNHNDVILTYPISWDARWLISGVSQLQSEMNSWLLLLIKTLCMMLLNKNKDQYLVMSLISGIGKKQHCTGRLRTSNDRMYLSQYRKQTILM